MKKRESSRECMEGGRERGKADSAIGKVQPDGETGMGIRCCENENVQTSSAKARISNSYKSGIQDNIGKLTRTPKRVDTCILPLPRPRTRCSNLRCGEPATQTEKRLPPPPPSPKTLVKRGQAPCMGPSRYDFLLAEEGRGCQE